MIRITARAVFIGCTTTPYLLLLLLRIKWFKMLCMCRTYTLCAERHAIQPRCVTSALSKEFILALSLKAECVKVTLRSLLAGNLIGPPSKAGALPVRVSRRVISDTVPSDVLRLASAGPVGAGTKRDEGSCSLTPSVSNTRLSKLQSTAAV